MNWPPGGRKVPSGEQRQSDTSATANAELVPGDVRPMLASATPGCTAALIRNLLEQFIDGQTGGPWRNRAREPSQTISTRVQATATLPALVAHPAAALGKAFPRAMDAFIFCRFLLDAGA